MTEPRPPIHPAPGDWPAPAQDTMAIVVEQLRKERKLVKDLRTELNATYEERNQYFHETERLRAELADWKDAARSEADRVNELTAELAAANERAEKAEQALREQPDWQRHWQHQVSRREEVQATLAGVLLERDSYHAQWQTALRELAKKDAALREAKNTIIYAKTSPIVDYKHYDATLATIRAALEPRKEGGE